MSINLKPTELIRRKLDTGEFIFPNKNKCTGCKKCVLICPVYLWKMEKNKAVLSKDYKSKCFECSSCYQICEYDAIEFTFPKGGTGIAYKQG